MYAAVQVPRRSLDDHRSHAGDEVIHRLRSLADPLRGLRVLHLSISPFGTNVADLLHGLVPLMRDLGIQADWQVAGCNGEFGRVARLVYAGLSGRRVEWTTADQESWHLYGESNGMLFEGTYDVVVVHDSQLAGLPAALAEQGSAAERGRWVWHCHLDLRGAQTEVLNAILPSLRHYDAWVLPDAAFAPPEAGIGRPVVIPPAIDPTGARNMKLPPASVRQFLRRYGLDSGRPLLVQAGPFDGSFDPVGAIEVYRRAKAQRQDLQLLLVHSMVEASLDAWSRFERIARYVGADGDAHVLCGQGDGSQVLVNAAQRAATVAIQRSVPAGFASQVWEAQWKGRPALVGTSGGLPAQVADGVTGYAAADEDRFVEAVLALVADPARAERLGAAGRQWVRQRHLITRLLGDELRLLRRLLAGAPSGAEQEVLVHA